MIMDDILKLMDTLENTNKAYEAARLKTQEAAAKERRALNTVNLSQKQFDEAITILRGDAPFNSDWYNLVRARDRK